MNISTICALVDRKIFGMFGNDRGLVVSSELVLVGTILILGLIVGLVAVRDAAISEVSDLAGAVQDLNQQYSYAGISGPSSAVPGSEFIDASDFGDDADDSAGAIDNCVVFFAPSDESGGGDDGGGDDGLSLIHI